MKKMMVWLAESFAPKCKKAFDPWVNPKFCVNSICGSNRAR